jgi:DUF1680 family protein
MTTATLHPSAVGAGAALARPVTVRFNPGGELGRRLKAVTGQWLLPVTDANPRILEMFRERDLQPFANQVPWAGEFAGKHLTNATQILRLTGANKLREKLAWFVGELVALQAEDGYLGPWPKEYRLRKGAPNCERFNLPQVEPWDAWGHYHIMLGLLLWNELAADPRAFDCARRIADLLVRRFLRGPEKLHDTGEHEMNQAPVHALTMLYRLTGDADYLALARKIVEEFALPPAGDYYRQGLAGVPFHQTPKPRWESLHPIMGLVELYYAAGDDTYRRAFENLWWSMLEGDRHNNGGFTSGEKATGNPYHAGAIETCCTVAWSAMTVEMLKLTGNPVVADELELTLFNSGFGMMSPSGRWVTYNTPMEGTRQASAHAIVFQARAGSPELNCCSVNGPRILGLVGEWALLTGKPGELFLNYYGAGTIATPLHSGQTLRLTQKTTYPVGGKVKIAVGLEKAENFILALRIPAWSEQTKVVVNGETLAAPQPGKYLRLERDWQPGDSVEMELDMRPHLWANPCGQRVSEPGSGGEKEAAAPAAMDDLATTERPASIYRGPLLLAYDLALNGGTDGLKPGFDADTLRLEPATTDRAWLAPQLLLKARNRNGQEVRLCDFASAGLSGSRYETWLPVRFAASPTSAFTRNNPLRSIHPRNSKGCNTP